MTGQRLPNRVRDYIDRLSANLVTAYDIATSDDPTPRGKPSGMEYYREEKQRILDRSREINWSTEGSERLVVGLGRTFDGEFIFEDRRRVVAKLQPSLANRDSRHAANDAAVAAWRYATDRGDGVFADMYDWSKSRTWLAMEGCIPIVTGGAADVAEDVDWLEAEAVSEEMTELRRRIKSTGWSVNTKRGNVGLTEDGRAVVVDIGGHTEHEDVSFRNGERA